MKSIKTILDSALALHNRYIPALLLIAISFLGIFISIHTFVNTITKDGDILNMSGKQRMLSQQTLILTKTYVNSLKEQDYEILMESINELKKAHSVLHRHLPTEKLKNIYKNDLKIVLNSYLDKLQHSIKNKDITDYSQLRHESQRLLKILDSIVEEYKIHYEQKVWKLKFVIAIFLVLALLLLMLTGRYIFYPASNKIKKYNDKLVNELLTLNETINSYVIMSKTDLNGIITYVSDEFCRISGYAKEELLGKTHSVVRHPSVKKEVFVKFWSTISSGKTYRGIVLNQNKDGSDFWFESFVYPEYDEHGHIKGYVALRKDITDKKELEKLNETLEEKVIKKTKELQKANKELSNLLKERTKEKEFIQDIIDLQQQSIIVYEQNKLLNANNYFLNFFACKDLDLI